MKRRQIYTCRLFTVHLKQSLWSLIIPRILFQNRIGIQCAFRKRENQQMRTVGRSALEPALGGKYRSACTCFEADDMTPSVCFHGRLITALIHKSSIANGPTPAV